MAFGGSTNTVLAPDGHRERSGVPHHHGRLGCGQRAHAALGEARALRPAPAHRPVPCRRRAGGHGGAGRLGLLDESALTCMGPLPEYLARCCPPADGEVCRTGENPYSAQGALKVLYGNLAPDGSVVKKAAVDPSMLCHTGPAACSIRKRRPARPSTAARSPREMWWSSATRGRPEARACARCSRPPRPSAAWAFHLGGPDHRRALLRRHQGAGRGAREPRGGGRRPHRPHLRGRFRHRGHRGRRADAERERRGARAPARGVGATGAKHDGGRVGQVRETGNFCRQGGDIL